MRRMRARGGGKVQAIFWLLVLVVIIYLGVKIIPVYANDYELGDVIETEARFGAVQNREISVIRENIWRRIRELKIPVEPENLKVSREGRTVSVTCKYTVEVALPGYTMRLNFQHQADNRGMF